MRNDDLNNQLNVDSAIQLKDIEIHKSYTRLHAIKQSENIAQEMRLNGLDIC